MGNKILEFFGLAGSNEVVVDSRRRGRRDDYMKKFHRLVVPEDDEEGKDTDAPVKGYVAVKDDPLTDDVPAPRAAQAEPEAEPGPEEPAAVKAPRAESSGRGAHAAPEDKKLSNKLRSFGESLRRPRDGAQPLVLVKKGAREMLEDIEEALVDGQTVLLDFEQEDRKVAAEVVTRIVNFVRVHNGAFYTITKTSLLLSLEKNSVVEWLPEEPGAAGR